MSSDNNTLGNFLKEKRTQSGLSQSEVSSKLGYSTPQFISNWERGMSSPPLNVLDKLAKMYGISSEELFEISMNAKIEDITRDMKRKFYGT